VTIFVFLPFQAVAVVVAVAVDDFGLFEFLGPPLTFSLEGDDGPVLVGVDVPSPLVEVEVGGVLPQAPMGGGNDLVVGADSSPERGGKSNGFSVIWSPAGFSGE